MPMPSEQKDRLLRLYHANYESHFKGANYLFVAHGAGLLGCLAILKDYASTPQYKGVGFFIIVFAWTVIWLTWNMIAPKAARFDPYPAFVLWLFISNMIQLFLMPLIMVGQNVQSVQADLREEEDLKINLQAELEIETILTHLEYQNEIMMKILKRLEDKAEA